VSLAVWRNLLPNIFQGGLQPGSPSRRAAPAGDQIALESQWRYRWIRKTAAHAWGTLRVCVTSFTHFTLHCYGIGVGLRIPQITQAPPWVSHRADWARIFSTICDSANPTFTTSSPSSSLWFSLLTVIFRTTLNKITSRRFQLHLRKAPFCSGISFHVFIFTYSPAFATP